MIERDKKLHFGGNFGMVILVAACVRAAGHGMPTQLLIAIAVAMAVSLAKELIWDGVLRRGTPDKRDMVANILGQASGAAAWAGVLAL